eukprot:gene13712-17507_t
MLAIKRGFVRGDQEWLYELDFVVGDARLSVPREPE